MNKAAAACSASCDVALLGRELARVLECVDGVYCFIASNGFDARKTQGETAGVSCAWLNGIEGDLEHDVGFHFTITATVNNRMAFKMFRQLGNLEVSQTTVGFADGQ